MENQEQTLDPGSVEPGSSSLTRRRWTADEDDYVRELYKQVPAPEIAEVLGRSVTSVRQRAKTLGVQGAAAPPESAQKSLRPEGPWICTSCTEEKPLSEFYLAEDGRKQDYRCKECRKADRRRRWAADPESRKRNQARRLRDPEVFAAHQRAYRLRTNFGITVDQYDSMFEKQDGKCAICSQPETKIHHTTGRPQALAIDHDHSCCPGQKTCGKCLRGLLCSECNQLLGKIENRGLLEGLMDYVRFTTVKTRPDALPVVVKSQMAFPAETYLPRA